MAPLKAEVATDLLVEIVCPVEFGFHLVKFRFKSFDRGFLLYEECRVPA